MEKNAILEIIDDQLINLKVITKKSLNRTFSTLNILNLIDISLQITIVSYLYFRGSRRKLNAVFSKGSHGQPDQVAQHLLVVHRLAPPSDFAVPRPPERGLGRWLPLLPSSPALGLAGSPPLQGAGVRHGRRRRGIPGRPQGPVGRGRVPGERTVQVQAPGLA